MVRVTATAYGLGNPLAPGGVYEGSDTRQRGNKVKGLKFVGLGVAIWGLSLIWPEVNMVLTPAVMRGLGLLYSASAPLGAH